MKKDKKNILIIEDETMILEALEDKLTSEGFEVFFAKDGKGGGGNGAGNKAGFNTS